MVELGFILDSSLFFGLRDSLHARLYLEEHAVMKIGFIGLGQMGAAMAANLLKAGHEVAVYNRTASKAEALVRLGALSDTAGGVLSIKTGDETSSSVRATLAALEG